MNYATRFFVGFNYRFFLSHLLCLNFPGKPTRAYGFYTVKSYHKLEKTLTLVACLLYDLADEREVSLHTHF